MYVCVCVRVCECMYVCVCVCVCVRASSSKLMFWIIFEYESLCLSKMIFEAIQLVYFYGIWTLLVY